MEIICKKYVLCLAIRTRIIKNKNQNQFPTYKSIYIIQLHLHD